LILRVLPAQVTIRTIVNFDPKYMLGLEAGPIVCPILAFVSGVYGLSNWTTVAMTFDRFLAVRFPLKAASWCTMKRSKVTVVCIFIFCTVILIPYSLRSLNLRAIVVNQICGFDPNMFPSWFPTLMNAVHTHGFFTSPFCAIIFFNISIIVTLVINRLKSDKTILSSKSKSSTNDGHITVLLLCVTLVFFVTNIPWTIDQWIWNSVLSNRHMTARLSMIRKVSYELIVFVRFINPAINFYTYCLGCRKFRNDVKSIFCHIQKR
jgi:hypothetical protein